MPSKPNIAIVGPSGSGKSTSLRNLPRKGTAFIDLERKGLPFIGEPFDVYTEVFSDQGNAFVIKTIKELSKNPAIDTIVIDSFTEYWQMCLKTSRLTQTGYDIWSCFARLVNTFLDTIRDSGKIVIVTALDEIVKITTPEGSEQNQIRIAVQGKELEGKIEQKFLCALWCKVRKDKDKMHYEFVTQTDGVCSAKSPMWLELQNPMENDVNIVLQKLIKK